MDSVTIAFWGFIAGLLYCLIRWKPQNVVPRIARIFLFFITLIVISMFICFGFFGRSNFVGWLMIVIGILLLVFIWWNFGKLLMKQKKEIVSSQKREMPFEKNILYINLAVILFFSFGTIITGFLTFILSIPLYIFVIGVLCSITVIALNDGIRKFKEKGSKSFTALALCLATVLIVIFIPLSRIGFYTDFWLLLIPRENIVHQIQKGTLKPEGCCDVALPWWGIILSRPGGNLRIMQFKKLCVMFYDYQGILSNASGFVYSEEDNPEDSLGGLGSVKFKLKDHWFYVVSD